MRSPYPTPKIKEALHQIKKELNSSETFHYESSSETPLRTKKGNSLLLLLSQIKVE